MATTSIGDVFVPDLYAMYSQENSPEKTAFYESGIVVRNSLLDGKANEGGRVVDLPFWKDLDATDEPNIGNDNPATTATPAKITSGIQVARKAFINNGWSAADLAGELAGDSPNQAIARRTSPYWQRQWQRRLINSAIGIIEDNVDNDGSDMGVDVSAEITANVSAATKFTRSTFTNATFTQGDAFTNTTAIAVHSVIYKSMVDADDITFIPDSQGRLVIPTYMGLRVIVDDGMPVVEGTADTGAGEVAALKYTSILFGEGAFGYGDGSPRVPVEIEREASQGNGAGIETLWERKTWLLHPFGFEFASGSVAGNSATLAELKLAANWDRVVERKNVPLAFIVTNG